MSVPRAVVARAAPTIKPELTTPQPWRPKPTPRQTTSDASQPSRRHHKGPAPNGWKIDFKTGEEKEKSQPEIGQHLNSRPRVCPSQACGPTRIPRPISATTRGSRIHGTHSHKMGATAAMVKIRSRECSSFSAMNQTGRFLVVPVGIGDLFSFDKHFELARAHSLQEGFVVAVRFDRRRR